MTHLQFHQLNESQQLKIVEKKAVLLTEKATAYCDVRLYQLDGFYVELHHHTHFNVVTRINSFTDPDLLESYLQDISLDDLFASA